MQCGLLPQYYHQPQCDNVCVCMCVCATVSDSQILPNGGGVAPNSAPGLAGLFGKHDLLLGIVESHIICSEGGFAQDEMALHALDTLT